MLYLGIDQHARQITISRRDDNGDVLQARQVSTRPEKINTFFQQLTRERLGNGESFIAVLEVCGFNDWLIRMLYDYRCHKVILTSTILMHLLERDMCNSSFLKAFELRHALLGTWKQITAVLAVFLDLDCTCGNLAREP